LAGQIAEAMKANNFSRDSPAVRMKTGVAGEFTAD